MPHLFHAEPLIFFPWCGGRSLLLSMSSLSPQKAMVLVVDVVAVVVVALEVVVVAVEEEKALEVKDLVEVKGTLAITIAVFQPHPLKILASSQPWVESENL